MPRLEFTTEGYPFYTTDDDIVAARDYVSRLPVELPQNLIGEKTGQAITNLVAPVGETPRFQTWPEKMVRSGATLPGDVASGRIPMNLGLRREDFTDIPDVPGKSDTWLGKKLGLSEGAELGPSGELIERTQDLSGMAGGGSLATAKGATLGSGPVRKIKVGNKELPIEKTFDVNGSPEYTIKDGNTHVANARLSTNGDYVVDLGVSPDFRRKGIATKLYDHIEEDLGVKLKPSPVYQTEAGNAFWKSRLSSDTSASAPVSALAKAPVFYSAVEHAINNSKTKTASAEQWLGEIRNQPGVKQEELDWVLHELPKGQITKSELEAFVKEHKVELKEVVSGNHPDFPKMQALEERARNLEAHGETDEAAALRERIRAFPPNPNIRPKYSQWQLPGGENYREMLLSLPPKAGAFDPSKVSYKKLRDYQDNNSYRLMYDNKEIGTFTDYKDNPRAHEEWVDIVRRRFGGDPNLGIKPLDSNNFTSSHWDEPNVIAHIRTNERVIPGVGYSVQNTRSGNKSKVFATREEAEAFQKTLPGSIGTKVIEDNLLTKTLHVEEIQSDWHQKGRKEGYKGEKEELQSKFDKIEEKIMKSEDESVLANPELKDALKTAVDKGIITKDEAKVYQRYTEIESGSPVPNAPFKSNWADLALKRIIRQAVDEGKDAISWTPGEAQAARYDLSKQVDRISYAKQNDGKYSISIRKGREELLNKRNLSERELEETIGKEAAKKIVDNVGRDIGEPIGAGTLEGLDLKIGGEGMKAFYDKMLVDKANAIVKKFGGKVEQANLPGKGIEPDTSHQALADLSNAMNKELTKSQPIHILRITPQLRDAAMNKGFSLFADTGKVGAPLAALTKVEYNPFTTDAYHGTRKFKGSKIEPKIAYEIHDNNGTFSVWDKTLKRTISPELKTEAEAKSWVDRRIGSEFFSTPNAELAGEYGTHVLPLKLDTRDYHTFDAKGGNWQYANKHAIFEAEQLGKKGVIIKNVVDNAGGKDFGPQTVNITLDPSTVRSRFAKFDPAKFGESGLLKATGFPYLITDDKGNQLIPKSRDEQTASGALLPTHEGNKPVDLPSGKTLGLAAAKAGEYALWAARPSLGPALWGTSAIVGAAMNAAPKKEIKTLNKVKLIPIKGDPWGK